MYPENFLSVFHQDTVGIPTQDTSRYIKIHQDTFMYVALRFIIECILPRDIYPKFKIHSGYIRYTFKIHGTQDTFTIMIYDTSECISLNV